jgi:AAA+ ATPase superfamily predicted ATPase
MIVGQRPQGKASSTKRFEESVTPGSVLFSAQNWYSTIDRDLFGEVYPGFASGVGRTFGNRSRRLQFARANEYAIERQIRLIVSALAEEGVVPDIEVTGVL